MAVPFLVVFLADHPRPTRRQGSGGGPPPQDLRTAGQPPARSRVRDASRRGRRASGSLQAADQQCLKDVSILGLSSAETQRAMALSWTFLVGRDGIEPPT